MACKVGSFSTGTGAVSSTVAVTGVGFTPVFVLFWWAGRTETTDTAGAANHRHGFGAMSSTERLCVISHSTNGGASAESDAGQRDDACVASQDTAGAIDGLLDFSSFDSDGFTLIVDDVMPSDMRVHYMAFDSTITNVDLGMFTEPATATTQDINVGWTPSGDDTAVFFMCFSNNTANPPQTGTDSRRCFGVCAGATPTNYVWYGGSNDGAATMQTQSYCRSGESIAGGEGAVTVTNMRGGISSWITNGFRITWNEVTGNATRRILYAAVRGGKWFAGDLTTATNTTAFAETGVGFQPKGVLFVSHCKTASTADTPQDHDECSMGAVDTSLNQRAVGIIDEDATANAEVTTSVEHDQVYVNLSTASAVEGAMGVNSLDSDGFTLQMSDADPTGAFVWYLAQADGAQTISPSGVASGEAFGTAQLNRDLIAGSVASAEAFGTTSINRDIQPTAITSLEAFGTSRVDMSLLLTGITSAEAFGNPTIQPGNVDVSPSGVPSAETFGTPSVEPQINPSGVPSAEAFGTPQIDRTLPAGSANSAEAFGTPTINQEVVPSGIASAEAFGTPTVQQAGVQVEPTGIPSAEAFGTPQIDRTLPAGSVASAEAFGTPQLNRDLIAGSVPSAEAFGTPTIVEEVAPTGVPSAEAFGAPQLDRTLPAGSVPSAEAFGTADVSQNSFVSPSGIPSSETFGTPQLDRTLPASSVPSAEAFGTAMVQQDQTVNPSGVASAEAFGTADVSQNSFVSPNGIPSAEAFGIPQLNRDLLAAGIASAEAFGAAVIVLEVRPSGVASLEAFGTAAIHRTLPAGFVPSGEAFGNPTMALFVGPNGIPSGEAFGVPLLILTISPSGIASLEVFGTATIQQGGPIITATGIPSGEVFGIPFIQAAGSSGSPNEPASMSQSVGQTFVTVSIGTPYDPTGGASAPGAGSSVGTPYKPGGGVP